MQAKSSTHLSEVVSTTSKAMKSTKEANQKGRKISIKISVRNDQDPQILPLTQVANNQAQVRVHRAVLNHQNFSREIVRKVMAVSTGNTMLMLQTHLT